MCLTVDSRLIVSIYICMKKKRITTKVQMSIWYWRPRLRDLNDLSWQLSDDTSIFSRQRCVIQSRYHLCISIETIILTRVHPSALRNTYRKFISSRRILCRALTRDVSFSTCILCSRSEWHCSERAAYDETIYMMYDSTLSRRHFHSGDCYSFLDRVFRCRKEVLVSYSIFFSDTVCVRSRKNTLNFNGVRAELSTLHSLHIYIHPSKNVNSSSSRTSSA